ncbi:MAG TPA: hypothetical protein VM661_05465 [Candidatus Sulfotelmatobacter sp.]|nr:hypothetical protein [Candidatus Sulfotelmatobacter sp.]
MAVILAFALAARLRAGRPDISPLAVPLAVVGRTVSPFRWILDPDSGLLVCRFQGEAADPDPLSRLPKAA